MFIAGLSVILSFVALDVDEQSTLLNGTVKDAEGNIYIRAATVTVKNKDGNQVHPTVLTDAGQHFEIEDLPEGTYTVIANFSGYHPGKKQVHLEYGEETEINLELTAKES